MLSVAGRWLSNFRDGIEFLRSAVCNIVPLLENFPRRTEAHSEATAGKCSYESHIHSHDNDCRIAHIRLLISFPLI